MANYDLIRATLSGGGVDYEDSYYTEGKNLKIKSQMKQAKKAYKAAMKAAKKMVKAGNPAKAKAELGKAKKIIQNALSEVNNIDESMPSMIIGRWLNELSGFIQVGLVTLLTFPIGGIPGFVMAIKRSVATLSGIVNDFKKNGNDIGYSTFNTYRSRLVGLMKMLIKNIEKMEKNINVMIDNKDEDEEDSNVKESVICDFLAMESSIDPEDIDDIVAMMD